MDQNDRLDQLERTLKNKIVTIAQDQSRHLSNKLTLATADGKAAVVHQTDIMRKYMFDIATVLQQNSTS